MSRKSTVLKFFIMEFCPKWANYEYFLYICTKLK